MPWCTLCHVTTVFQIECALVSFHNLDIVYKSFLCLQLESSFIENLSNKNMSKMELFRQQQMIEIYLN